MLKQSNSSFMVYVPYQNNVITRESFNWQPTCNNKNIHFLLPSSRQMHCSSYVQFNSSVTLHVYTKEYAQL